LNEAQNYAFEHARPVVTAMSYNTHEISIAYADEQFCLVAVPVTTLHVLSLK